MLLTNYNAPITQRQQAVIPCADQANMGGMQVRDLWMILAIQNTTANRGKASLFDASGAFELKEGIQNQDGILISGQNLNYDTVLRDLVSGEQYCFDVTQVEVITGSNLQLDNPWKFYKDLGFSLGTQFVNQIDPSIAKDAYQQQANRLKVVAPYSITRKTLMEIDIEANTTMVLRMHLNKAVTNG